MRTRFRALGSVGADASGTTRSTTAFAVFPGDGIRGGFKFEGGGTTTFKVTDTAGNVYRSAIGKPGFDANGLRINPNGDLGVGIFWCDSAKGHPANIVTVTLGAARTYYRVFAMSEEGAATHDSLCDIRIQEATTGTTSTFVNLPRGGTLIAILGEYASTTWASPGDPYVTVVQSGSTGFAYRAGLGVGGHHGAFSGAGIEADTQILATFAPRIHPRLRDWAAEAPAGGAFKAAWARGSNQVLGTGAIVR